jgi:hypothetical protein
MISGHLGNQRRIENQMDQNNTGRRKQETRAQRNIRWIEKHCVIPGGPDKGRYVHLSSAQKESMFKIYDGSESLPVDDLELAAYLALLHLCGQEATGGNDFIPQISVDTFTVWAASESPTLRPVLERKGEHVICPALGTRYPRAA